MTEQTPESREGTPTPLRLEAHLIQLSENNARFLDWNDRSRSVLSGRCHEEVERLKRLVTDDPEHPEFGNLVYVNSKKKGLYFPEVPTRGDSDGVSLVPVNAPGLYPVVPIHIHPDQQAFSPGDIRIVITDSKERSSGACLLRRC